MAVNASKIKIAKAKIVLKLLVSVTWSINAAQNLTLIDASVILAKSIKSAFLVIV